MHSYSLGRYVGNFTDIGTDHRMQTKSAKTRAHTTPKITLTHDFIAYNYAKSVNYITEVNR